MTIQKLRDCKTHEYGIQSLNTQDVVAAIAEIERLTSENSALRKSLGRPDEITAEPHEDYDCLKKQYLALRSLANSKCRMASHWLDASNQLTREMLLTKGGIIDAERNTNAMLTDQLLQVEQERDQLRERVDDAAASLNTIATQAGKVDGLTDMIDVRSYARNRAICAGYYNQMEAGG